MKIKVTKVKWGDLELDLAGDHTVDVAAAPPPEKLDKLNQIRRLLGLYGERDHQSFAE